MISNQGDNEKSSSSNASTSSSELSNVSLMTPTRKDLISVLIVVIGFIICLIIALCSYFLVQMNVNYQAKIDLNNKAVVAINNLNTAFENVIVKMSDVQYLFSITQGKMDYFKQFIPFCYSTGQFSQYIMSMAYADYVLTEDLDRFVTTMRASAPYLSNLTLSGRDTLNRPTPILANSTLFHYPTTYIAPYRADLILQIGYDHSSSPMRMNIINKSIINKSMTASNKITLFNINQTGILVYAPVFDSLNTSKYLGVSFSVINVNELIQNTISDLVDLMSLSISEVDTKNLSQDLYFIYNTLQYRNKVYHPMSYEDNKKVIDSAPFKSEHNITFVDRQWNVIFIPSSRFIEIYQQDVNKWIGTIVSIILMLITIATAILVFFLSRLIYVQNRRKETSIKVASLKEQYKNQTSLLNRITTQEQTTRTILDAVPQCIVSISQQGKIIQANAEFDTMFKFSQDKFSQGLYINSVVPKLEFNFFKGTASGEYIGIEACNSESNYFMVDLKYKDISQETNAEDIDKEAYVIIINKSIQNK